MYLKKNNGITMIALVSMVIVLLILASITITQGTSLLKKTKMENIITNMITMRAKAKIYSEEINAQVWDSDDQSTERETLFASQYNMLQIDSSEISSKIKDTTITGSNYECYEITQETLRYMGLDSLIDDTNDGDYIVVYNSDDYTDLDIIYNAGLQYNSITYYTLSSMQTVMGE